MYDNPWRSSAEQLAQQTDAAAVGGSPRESSDVPNVDPHAVPVLDPSLLETDGEGYVWHKLSDGRALRLCMSKYSLADELAHLEPFCSAVTFQPPWGQHQPFLSPWLSPSAAGSPRPPPHSSPRPSPSSPGGTRLTLPALFRPASGESDGPSDGPVYVSQSYALRGTLRQEDGKLQPVTYFHEWRTEVAPPGKYWPAERAAAILTELSKKTGTKKFKLEWPDGVPQFGPFERLDWRDNVWTVPPLPASVSPGGQSSRATPLLARRLFTASASAKSKLQLHKDSQGSDASAEYMLYRGQVPDGGTVRDVHDNALPSPSVYSLVVMDGEYPALMPVDQPRSRLVSELVDKTSPYIA